MEKREERSTRDRERLGFSLFWGLISRFLSLGVVWSLGLPLSSFPSRDGDFFPRIFSHRALILTDPLGVPAASSGVESQVR